MLPFHPTHGYPVFFVHTPGFDDTYKSDAEILAMIIAWLKKARNAKLATILYLHRISDNRVAGSAMINLRTFLSFFRQRAMPNLIIATTMWNELRMEEIGVNREEELKECFLKDMVADGCRIERFKDTHDSVWRIIGDFEQNNRIVLVMGPSGSGKSTFIHYATGRGSTTVGHRWKSSTTDIESVSVTHPTDGHPIIFVDTPGFDHSSMSDMEVLTMISDWLVKAYKGHVNIVRILYLHRISDNRMPKSAMKNLRIFSNLCGQQAMPNVVIVTTMWSFIPEELGTTRENDLKQEVWKDMLGDGCRIMRFKDTYQSSWDIVGNIAQKDSGTSLLIQEEMGTVGRSFNQTKTGIDLDTATEMRVESLLNKIRRWLFIGRL